MCSLLAAECSKLAARETCCCVVLQHAAVVVRALGRGITRLRLLWPRCTTDAVDPSRLLGQSADTYFFTAVGGRVEKRGARQPKWLNG